MDDFKSQETDSRTAWTPLPSLDQVEMIRSKSLSDFRPWGKTMVITPNLNNSVSLGHEPSTCDSGRTSPVDHGLQKTNKPTLVSPVLVSPVLSPLLEPTRTER